MAKIIVTEFVTLDGVIDAPYAWSRAFWSDEIQAIKRAELFGAEALLLGRVTYDGFAASWPARRGTDEFADRINAMPKFVVSRTLADTSWHGTRVLGADALAAVRALKQELTGDLLVYGSNRLAVSLLRAGLVDEVHVLSYPIVHSDAPRSEATAWNEIVALYAQLYALMPTPVVALNRAVAVAELGAPARALALLEPLELDGYHLFHAVRADLLTRLGRLAEADAAYAKAASLTANAGELKLLARRQAELAERLRRAAN